MKLNRLTIGLSVTLVFASGRLGIASDRSTSGTKLEIVESTYSDIEPPMHMACYTHIKGPEMIGPAGISPDVGRTWKRFAPTPDFSAGLPRGYRRVPFPAVIDPHNGHIVDVYNALDTPDLDPNIEEPPVALNAYYLRYRISTDAGRTWLFDEPVIQQGRTEDHPIDGVWKGKNGVYFGDIGCLPLFSSRHELLVPVQICPLGPNGKLANPGGGPTYHETAILIGRWDKHDRLSWDMPHPIVGDPARTTRGVFEPTLAELPDGRILVIMRGSNARRLKDDLPSYKWRSVSSDGGRTWTAPDPWTYADGQTFFSPSSMSRLFTHSSGRIFWIGNITPENADGNSPRYPLVMGEVDPSTLSLVKHSILELDSRKSGEGRVDLSHFRGRKIAIPSKLS